MYEILTPVPNTLPSYSGVENFINTSTYYIVNTVMSNGSFEDFPKNSNRFVHRPYELFENVLVFLKIARESLTNKT